VTGLETGSAPPSSEYGSFQLDLETRIGTGTLKNGVPRADTAQTRCRARCHPPVILTRAENPPRRAGPDRHDASVGERWRSFVGAARSRDSARATTVAAARRFHGLNFTALRLGPIQRARRGHWVETQITQQRMGALEESTSNILTPVDAALKARGEKSAASVCDLHPNRVILSGLCQYRVVWRFLSDDIGSLF